MLAKTEEKNFRSGRAVRTMDVAEGLVRKLVAQASTAPHPKRALKAEENDLLFACEIDGIRCTLVKTSPEQTPAVALSPREQEIARMVAKGFPNKAIAGVLDISVWTVSTHLRRVFAKLGVSSRAAMVAKILGEHASIDRARL